MSTDPPPTSSAAPAASVVLPTRNRRDYLRRAIQSSLDQTVPVEVLVFDDASTDGTAEMVQSEFPQVRFFRYDKPVGPCVTRNRGAELAAAPIIFPIDDDAAFASRHTIEQTLADFDHPRVAAVAIPHINVNQGPEVRGAPPDRQGIYLLSEYVGASHALRRDVVVRLGGYRTHFFYMGEEPDLCIRLLSAGYITRVGRADPIHHFESPQRIRKRAWALQARNKILFAWHNVPWPHLPLHLAGASFNLLRAGLRQGHLLWALQGVSWGWASILPQLGNRQPVAPSAYRITRTLVRQTFLELSEVEHALPPLRP
jgi:glycosyltransferase involved in cell wall biosynthesis